MEVKKFLEDVAKGQVNAISVIRDLDGPDGAKVTVQLENTPVEPIRKESPARYHTFHEATGFVAYLKKNKTPNLIVLADVDGRKAAAVLDDTAEKGFENIILKPAFHPRFTTLMATILYGQGTEQNITRFAKRVMMCKEIIVKADNLDGKQLAMQMMQITVSHKITDCAGEGLTATNGVMCESKINGGVGSVTVELPETITVELPIFINTEPVKFDIELLITAGDSETPPSVIAMAPQMEEKIAEVFESILEPIKAIKDAIVSYGQLDTTAWKYID